MSQNNGDRDTSLTNLIVNYLPQSMTDKELFSMFVTIGPVESCRVMRDNKTGYSYGFGFVNFSKVEDAEKAISQLSGLQVQNKRLKVSYARPPSEDIKDTNLYITNLPRSLNEQQLENMFCRFGKIVQKNILKDKITGLPRGVAFVRYDKRSEAMQALAEMNGKVPEGCVEPLSIKIAEEHGKRKAAYYAGFQAGYVQSRGMGTTPTAVASITTGGPNSGGSGGGGAMKSDLARSRRSLLYPYLVPSSASRSFPNLNFK